MTHSIGVDMIEISRIQRTIERYGKRFLEKVFTEKEIEYCNRGKNDLWASYAARFAAKEAVMKALGTGWNKDVNWKDIEILNDEKGKPHLKLYHKAEEWTKNGKLLLSISHTMTDAIAFVVWEKMEV